VVLLVAFAAFLALYVVPGSWGDGLVAASLAVFAAEVMLSRSTRRLPLATGVETMIGSRAVVISSCQPAGRVQLGRESWKARCALGAGAEVGDAVIIDAVESATLVVHPAPERSLRLNAPGAPATTVPRCSHSA
jgi:membrane protein implicated in regulation of membrane protease activity